jgi:predicted dehydrogenase
MPVDGSPTTVLVVGLVRGGAVARELAKAPDFEIVGLVDLDPLRLEEVGSALGVSEKCRYVDLVQGLDECPSDIVLLAVPTPLHKQYSLAALAAGRHVVCEKPLALTLDEARELREAVARFDRRFMVAEQYRFAGGVENLRQAVADGRVGKLAYLAHEFHRGAQIAYPSNARRDDWMSRYREPGLQEMSVHHFDMWYYIAGSRIAEIYARPFDPDWNTSGRHFGYSIHATLENGTHVDYLTCRALAREQTTWYGDLTIVGEGGALAWDGVGSAVSLSTVLPSKNPQEQRLLDESLDYSQVPPDQATTAMFRALVDAIRAGKPHPSDAEDNWASFAASQAAVESARTGRPVEVAKR